MLRSFGFIERRAPGSLFELMPGLEIGPADRRFYLDDEIAGNSLFCWWKARDLALEDQDFDIHYKILKLFAPALASDPALVDWLNRAVERTAPLAHPHIAAVHHWAQGEDGWLYAVQEHIDGQDLGLYLLNRAPLNSAQSLALLGPLAEALDYAWQEHGLLHGNLRPENILVGEDGTLRLLDFGLTPAGLRRRIEGAAEYLPPESFTTTACDQTEDVFALACIAYEMLVGQSPFGIVEQSHGQADHAETRQRRINEAVWSVLKQGLAEDPKARPGSPTELWSRLQTALGR